MSRLLPWTTVRSSQRFAPEASTIKYNPLPSAYFPGVEEFLTWTDDRDLSGCQ